MSADNWTITVHDVEDACGNARFFKNLSEDIGRDRRNFRWLQNNRAACGQGWSDF